MEALDLKKFIWQNKKDEQFYTILAITDYKHDDVVVYRNAGMTNPILVTSVGDFCREFEAVYDIS